MVFKYLMINLKEMDKNNYLLLLLVALAVWVIYLLCLVFYAFLKMKVDTVLMV